ncbi:MAG: hypothetical protein ACRDOK_21585, partial [Streptosporangiaceae bacterium]
LWLILAGIAIGGPAIVITAALLLRARASRSAFRAAGQPAWPARAHVRRVTRCGLAGLGVGALIGAALIADNRGALAVLGCAGGYLAGLLVGEYTGQPPTREPVRSARLLARRPADYLPRWAAAAALLSAALVVAAPIAFAVAPTVRYGNWHPFPGASMTLPGGQTSWPPVFPGTAAAALLALAVLGIGAAGLRRVAARPGPADDDAATFDEVLRRQAGRAMVGAVLGLELITLAALLIAGSQGLAVPGAAVAPGAYLGNRVMVIAGLCCAATGLAAWLVLSGWTRHRRRAAPPAGTTAVVPDS